MVHGLGPSQDDSQGCSRPPVMKVHDGVMIMCDICVSAGVSVSTVSGQSPRAANAAAGLGMSKSAAKKESITARLSAGEPPWDMLSLKAAIHAALPGRHPLPTTGLSCRCAAARFFAWYWCCSSSRHACLHTAQLVQRMHGAQA